MFDVDITMDGGTDYFDEFLPDLSKEDRLNLFFRIEAVATMDLDPNYGADADGNRGIKVVSVADIGGIKITAYAGNPKLSDHKNKKLTEIDFDKLEESIKDYIIDALVDRTFDLHAIFEEERGYDG